MNAEVRHFAAAVDRWLAAHDAALADLTARHEAHKAQIAASEERFARFFAERDRQLVSLGEKL